MWTFLERHTYPEYPLHGNEVQLLKFTRFTLNKTNHNLGSDSKDFLPKCHTTNFGLKSFAYQAVSLWNKLLKSFRTCESLKDFKTKIVNWSIDNDM